MAVYRRDLGDPILCNVSSDTIIAEDVLAYWLAVHFIVRVSHDDHSLSLL